MHVEGLSRGFWKVELKVNLFLVQNVFNSRHARSGGMCIIKKLRRDQEVRGAVGTASLWERRGCGRGCRTCFQFRLRLLGSGSQGAASFFAQSQ